MMLQSQAVVDGWKEYFNLLQQTRNACNASSRPVPEDPLMERLLFKYWHAHEVASCDPAPSCPLDLI